MHETLLTLLRDPAHWEFELLLTVLFDGLLAGVLWPLVRRAFDHHDRKMHWHDHERARRGRS